MPFGEVKRSHCTGARLNRTNKNHLCENSRKALLPLNRSSTTKDTIVRWVELGQISAQECPFCEYPWAVSRLYSLIWQPLWIPVIQITHVFLSSFFICILIFVKALLTPHPDTHIQRESIIISSMPPRAFTFFITAFIILC